VTATGIYDLRATPFGPVSPGLEVQAAALDNLLTGRFVTRPGWADLADQLAIVLLGGVTGLVLARLRAVSGLLVTGLLGVAYALFTREVFVSAGAWLEVTHPILALTIIYTAVTVDAYLSEERQRRQITSAFGHYVSPAVIEQMLADPSRLELGGEERVLTVLFCDLAGFTGIAERHTPRQTIELLSEYLGTHDRVHLRARGDAEGVRRRRGDGDLRRAGRAARPRAARVPAALAMRTAREALAREWAERGGPALARATG
jgi:adenylate cyclase